MHCRGGELRSNVENTNHSTRRHHAPSSRVSKRIPFGDIQLISARKGHIIAINNVDKGQWKNTGCYQSDVM